MLAAALHGPALAGLGLAGAFVVPLLVESQQPNPWPLVIYLAVVAGAAYALARLRRWLWLAAAAVAGAVIWGLALTGSRRPRTAHSLWASALFVHVAMQLALAAAFMAIEPHLAVADDAAEPDWIAAAALAALTVLAVLALGAARMDAQWTAFAVVAMAILGAHRLAQRACGGGRSARRRRRARRRSPPGRACKAPPEPRLLAPALEGVLRLPENVSQLPDLRGARDARRRRCWRPCGCGAAARCRCTPPASTRSPPSCRRCWRWCWPTCA